MSEETYQAVKAAYRSYGTFIKDLAEEIDWEQILLIRKKLALERVKPQYSTSKHMTLRLV